MKKSTDKRKKMPFGKYKGKTLQWIACNYPSYGGWLVKNDVIPLTEDEKSLLASAEREFKINKEFYAKSREEKRKWGIGCAGGDSYHYDFGNEIPVINGFGGREYE